MSCRRPALALAFASLFGASAFLSDAESEACSQPLFPHVVLAARLTNPSGTVTIPKNAGLIFRASIGSLTDAEAREMVSVTVKSDGVPIEGTLTRVGRSTAEVVSWQWRPTSGDPLPSGNLAIHVAADNGWTTDQTVVVEDRLLGSAAPTMALYAKRVLSADPESPKIECGNRFGGSCDNGTATVATRALPRPEVSAELGGVAVDPSYFEPELRVFGRRNGQPDGAIDHVGWSATTQLAADLDEYCASAKTTSLVDGTEIVTEAVCLANTVDLSPPTEPEETAFIKSLLGSCGDPVYPTGTSADDPTGRRGPEPKPVPVTTPGSSNTSGSASDGGCAMRPTSSTSGGACLVLVGVAALGLRRRRAQR
jgi:hypothetical protein